MVKTIHVAIAPGELIDKITILQIKSERIENTDKLRNVRIELDLLMDARDEAIAETAELARITAELKAANEDLWDIEDNIRRCESRQDFGNEFVQLARSVYMTNDKRARLKRQINELLGSSIVEEKDYVAY